MIRVVVADDHPVVREGIKRIISDCSDIRVVAEAVDGNDAVGVAIGTAPDVLLLDVSMPGPGIFQALRRLREEAATTRVLVLSVHPEEQFAMRCIEAGASGYLSKDRSPESLLDAIRCIASGRRYLNPAVAEQLVRRALGDVEVPVHERLSPREYEVFLLLGSGKRVGEIAQDLRLSPKTVSTFRTRILAKTGLANNGAITRFAIDHHLLDSPPVGRNPT